MSGSSIIYLKPVGTSDYIFKKGLDHILIIKNPKILDTPPGGGPFVGFFICLS